jgi:catechol 2,3-dioxygenase-like lactoylglutathione lyase family enzyme
MTETIRGLHHVTAIAIDPQANIDFYTRLLGLRLVKANSAVSGQFTMATNDPNSAACKRHDGRTSDSGCARPSHRSRRGSSGVSSSCFFVSLGLGLFSTRLRVRASITSIRRQGEEFSKLGLEDDRHRGAIAKAAIAAARSAPLEQLDPERSIPASGPGSTRPCASALTRTRLRATPIRSTSARHLPSGKI